MTIRELISQLEDLPPESEVLLVTQPSYPLEHSIERVVVRSDLEWDGELEPTDVLLVEGRHLRYGSRAAWE